MGKQKLYIWEVIGTPNTRSLVVGADEKEAERNALNSGITSPYAAGKIGTLDPNYTGSSVIISTNL